VNASKHGRRTAVKAAGSIGMVLAVAEGAHLAGEARGTLAGVAVIAMAFLGCWIVVQLRQLLRPVPRRPREPQMPSAATPAALADGQEPARLAA
jgi:hypothetical protein